MFLRTDILAICWDNNLGKHQNIQIKVHEKTSA